MDITVFKNMTDRRPYTVRLEEVAARIAGDERLRTFTESYRKTGNKSFKTESPLFAVACRFSGGKSRGNVQCLTGLSLVDIDHAPDVEAMRARAVADPHTVLCYVTMSGQGLRVVFRYTLPTGTEADLADTKAMARAETNYKKIFAAGNAYYADLLGAEADLQCKNVTRLSTMAYDPKVFFRPPEEAAPFTHDEISTALGGLAKQNREVKIMKRIQSFYDMEIAPHLAQEGIVYAPGSHNDYVMRVGYRLAERRFARDTAIRWCERTFADYDETAQVVASCFDSVAARTGDDEEKPSRTGDRQWAGVEEIKAFLSRRIELRYNVITCRAEFRSKSDAGISGDAALTEGPPADGTAPIPRGPLPPWAGGDGGPEDPPPSDGDEGAPGAVPSGPETPQTNDGGAALSIPPPKEERQWLPVNDRVVNSLWSEMSREGKVSVQDIYRLIESDYVPQFNPFSDYVDSLPPPDGTDYLRQLAETVRVKGGKRQQQLWYHYLCKWMVAMVAAWLSEDVVNNVILVLIGQQGAYKTTWFNYLLPPRLKQYFYTKTNANRMGRDDLLTLAQYGLVCCEELDTMRPSELNQLKAAVTMTSIDERAAYAHYHEHRKHIASFCGTGNNVAFLTDPTGNRRWLPFEVESIVSPRDHPLPYEGIYAQAAKLYREGFVYWFTREEVQELNQRNRHFETPRLEKELVELFFRKPTGEEMGEFVSVARALQIISCGISQKLSDVNLGRAFVELGFKRVRTYTGRGFIAICRTGDEIRAFQKRQVLDCEEIVDDYPADDDSTESSEDPGQAMTHVRYDT